MTTGPNTPLPAQPPHNTHFNQHTATPMPVSQQSLSNAIFMKQEQLLAARLGHSNIPIEPLERQIARLQELLDEVKCRTCQDRCEESLEWVVVPTGIYHVNKGEEEGEGTESLQRDLAREILENRRAHLVQMQMRTRVSPGHGSDTEKILGTWL